MGQNKTKKRGGKVIASGGFGCVFSPALKCKNNERNDKNITKLMMKRDTLKEYNEIIEIKGRLENIPLFQDFFLLNNIDVCEIEPLFKSDKENFNEKCKPLKKDGITSKNINNKLKKLLALNIPHGGLPLDDYLTKNNSQSASAYIFEGLIHLLENGIVPMNKREVFHSDIKDSNVLIDDHPNSPKLRLIDWGLSVVMKTHNEIPKAWRNRPLQYNVPFSNIIFTEQFVYNYDTFLKHSDITEINIIRFVEKYLVYWKKERGVGHFKYIRSIVEMLTNELGEKENEASRKKWTENVTNHLIVRYISRILLKFTKGKILSARKILNQYMHETFKNSIDVWGLVMCYLPILEFLHNRKSGLSENDKKLCKHIKHVIGVHLYNTETSELPINTNVLIKDLKKIDYIMKFSSARKNKTRRKTK